MILVEWLCLFDTLNGRNMIIIADCFWYRLRLEIVMLGECGNKRRVVIGLGIVGLLNIALEMFKL